MLSPMNSLTGGNEPLRHSIRKPPREKALAALCGRKNRHRDRERTWRYREPGCGAAATPSRKVSNRHARTAHVVRQQTGSTSRRENSRHLSGKARFLFLPNSRSSRKPDVFGKSRTRPRSVASVSANNADSNRANLKLQRAHRFG